jgi:hypothetical protein
MLRQNIIAFLILLRRLSIERIGPADNENF